MFRPSPRGADAVRVACGALEVLALGWVLVLAFLLAAAPVAAAAGWRPALVVGASMTPAVRPGDVVLADPGAVPRLAKGQIVLARRPGYPDDLLTHRVTAVRADGGLVTRGDANDVDDSGVLSRDQVLGVVRVVVPQVGRPLVLVRRPSVGGALWTALAVAAVLLVGWGPSRRHLLVGAGG